MKAEIEELKNLRKADLKILVAKTKEDRLEIQKLKRELKLGKLKNSKKLHITKKHLARILTIISEKAEEQIQKQIQDVK